MLRLRFCPAPATASIDSLVCQWLVTDVDLGCVVDGDRQTDDMYLVRRPRLDTYRIHSMLRSAEQRARHLLPTKEYG